MQNIFQVLLVVLCAFHLHANSTVVVQPSNLTTFIGAHAKFTCVIPTERSLNLLWSLNGSIVPPNNSTAQNNCIINARFLRQTGTVMDASGVDVYYSNLTIGEPIRDCNNSIIYCEAFELSTSGHRVIIERSREATLNLQEFPPVKQLDLYASNNTICITWKVPDTDVNLDEESVTYKLTVSINNDDSWDDDHHTYDLEDRTTYLYHPPDPPRACTLFNMTITTFLNGHQGTPINEFGSAYQALPPTINQSILLTNVMSDGTYLIYDVILPSEIPVCFMKITATNIFTGEEFNITTKVNSPLDHLTTLTSLSIDNHDLPFDEKYNAAVEFHNPLQNASKLRDSLSLSTHDIQNITLNNGHNILISFVKNTSAQGAFLVFGNAESHCYNYTPIERNKSNKTEFNISRWVLCSSNCTLLVYTLKEDGLPKHNTSSSFMEYVRPVMEYPLQSKEHSRPESDCDSEQVRILNGVEARVEVKEGLITFTCDIRDHGQDDLLGCVAIMHSTLNYSALLVGTVAKNAQISAARAEKEEYLYVVFPQSKHFGLIGSPVIAKGIILQDTDTTNSPPLSAGVVAAIVCCILMLCVVVSAVLAVLGIYIYRYVSQSVAATMYIIIERSPQRSE